LSQLIKRLPIKGVVFVNVHVIHYEQNVESMVKAMGEENVESRGKKL